MMISTIEIDIVEQPYKRQQSNSVLNLNLVQLKLIGWHYKVKVKSKHRDSSS